MTIKQVINHLEQWAPLYLQEEYDNAGLQTGNEDWPCTGILCTLDATEDVVNEAIAKKCNLIVAHHPIIFRPIKKITNASYVERTIVKAIKNDIAIYAIHTNLDNSMDGVNTMMAQKLGVIEKSLAILSPKKDLLSKLFTYVPLPQVESVKIALFSAGAGAIGLYNECSFSVTGTGTFKPLPGADPFIGLAGGKREEVTEAKIEFIFPAMRQRQILQALFQSHPYEEVAYEIIRLENADQYSGSGLLGELPKAISEADFLQLAKKTFNLAVIRHTAFLERPVKKVALCGGAGSFLIKNAIAAQADAYITADVKYHEFFDADGKTLLLDIGHWESEQFTIELLYDVLRSKFPNFAVLKTKTNTNPVYYFL